MYAQPNRKKKFLVESPKVNENFFFDNQSKLTAVHIVWTVPHFKLYASLWDILIALKLNFR